MAAPALPFALLALAGPCQADAPEEPGKEWGSISFTYMGEGIRAVSGDTRRRVHYLDNISLEATLDFEGLFGWRGARLNVHGLSNAGGAPNDDVGTLEGVSNIEVADQGLRLFELFLEQQFDERWSGAIGFQDLNRDFYTTDAAGLLIAPPFGIGSEVASTGPNGPSIFPSAALGAKLRYVVEDAWYAQASVMDATAGVLGDPNGLQADFANGALFMGEVGITSRGKLAVGGWGYSDAQDDIRAVDAAGDPLRRGAYGFYALLERPLRPDTARAQAVGFARAGVSAGESTVFRGGGQVGLLASGFWRAVRTPRPPWVSATPRSTAQPAPIAAMHWWSRRTSLGWRSPTPTP